MSLPTSHPSKPARLSLHSESHHSALVPPEQKHFLNPTHFACPALARSAANTLCSLGSFSMTWALPLTHPWDGHRHHQGIPVCCWSDRSRGAFSWVTSSEVYFLVFYSKRSRCKPASGKLAAQKIPAQGLAKLKPTASSVFLMRGVR